MRNNPRAKEFVPKELDGVALWADDIKNLSLCTEHSQEFLLQVALLRELRGLREETAGLRNAVKTLLCNHEVEQGPKRSRPRPDGLNF